MKIQQYQIDLTGVDCEDFLKNPIVCYEWKYDLDTIIGKVVHLSKTKNIINVEFNKHSDIAKKIIRTGIETKAQLGVVDYKDGTMKLEAISINVDRPTIKAEYVR